MVSQSRFPLAPIDPAGVADSLRPFGQSRMLPRAAYVDPAVFAWEQRHFFDGGWTCVGPSQTQSLTELLDPEDEEGKRERIRLQVQADRTALSGSGVAADQIAARTHLPVQLVEDELGCD